MDTIVLPKMYGYEKEGWVLLANEHFVPQIIFHLEKLYDQDLQQ